MASCLPVNRLLSGIVRHWSVVDSALKFPMIRK